MSGWTTHMLQELNIEFETDGDDNDLVIVKHRNVRMFIRLSACRITPIGVDISQTKRLPLLDKDCIPKYDFDICKELVGIIRRGTKNHHRVVWIRNDKGIPVGIK